MAKNKSLRLVLGLFVFGVALGIRIEYQKQLIPEPPVRGDARLYVIGTYNLVHHGVFSISPDKAKGKIHPPTSFIPPGYSIFMAPFMRFSDSVSEFYQRVITGQAFLGTFISLFAFILALPILGTTGAFLVGILTAFSPHMISIETNLLTETLFSFLLLSAIMAQVFSVRNQNSAGAVLSGTLLGLAVITRPIIILLPFFLWTTFLFKKNHSQEGEKRVRLILFFIIGFILVKGSYEVRNFLSVKTASGTASRVWTNFLLGTYPNFTHSQSYGYPYRDDPLYYKMEKDFEFGSQEILRRFRENPENYIRWYFGGKQVGMWQWNLKPGGTSDVYVYPIKAGAFIKGGTLRWLRDLMEYLHPFVLLTGAAGLFMAVFKIFKRNDWVWSPVVVVVIYHTLLLTLLFPIPRLTIPLRPYLYLFSALCISKMFLLAGEIICMVGKHSNRKTIIKCIMGWYNSTQYLNQ